MTDLGSTQQGQRPPPPLGTGGMGIIILVDEVALEEDKETLPERSHTSASGAVSNPHVANLRTKGSDLSSVTINAAASQKIKRRL